MDDAVRILILSFIKVPLHLTWIKRLKTIRLYLKTFIDIAQVLDIVLNCLRSLLFHGEQANWFHVLG